MLSRRVSPADPTLPLMTEENPGPSPASPVIPTEDSAPNDCVLLTCTKEQKQLVTWLRKKEGCNECRQYPQRRMKIDRHTKHLVSNSKVRKFHLSREDRSCCIADCVPNRCVHVERRRVWYASRHPEIGADDRIRATILITRGEQMQTSSSATTPHHTALQLL